jgi:hypothetical protein
MYNPLRNKGNNHTGGKDMNATYFEEIKVRFIESARWTNNNAQSNDVNRNHVNYGRCITLARIIYDMGHKTDVPVWEDNGCLKIPYLEIDGEKVIEF